MNKILAAPFPVSFVAISLLASVTMSNSLATPQQDTDLAAKAYAVLEKHCAKCHGKDKMAGFTFHDYKAMVDNGHLAPGKPTASRLFVRAVNSPSDPMPPRSENNPLNEDEQKTLKAWIEAGAPPLKTEQPVAPHTFLNEADILQEIKADLIRASVRDRPYLRYFTLTHLANVGASEDDVQAFRVGLSKLLNSLSWQRTISAPQPIDAGKTILRIDLRKYWWTAQTWKKLLAAYPYAVVSETQTAKAIYAATNCPLPYVRADWFVSRAALPPLYHELLNLPDTAQKLEAKLGVDVEKNQNEETAMRAGLQESGVSRNNRVVERHISPYGAYWRSYDFKNNAGKENIYKHPLDFEAAGGEIIFNLPNGLQAYLLVNANGERIDTGPIDIVSNKENASDPVVRNGLTCMSCHAQGMKRFSDTMRAVLTAMPGGQNDSVRDHARALYVEKPKMEAALDEDTKRFANAVRETGATITTHEPIYALQGRYDSTMDIAQAAAEAGLPTETFQSRLQKNVRLGALLGPLITAVGRLKRDAWEEYFGDVVRELHLGFYLKPAAPQPAAPSGTTSLPITATSGTTAPPGTAAPQQASYVQFVANSHWYTQVTLDADITWENAEARAEKMTYRGWRGHLVTLTSAEESQFVLQRFPDAVKGVYWIGAFKYLAKADPGNPATGWAWVTGEAWNYTNWNPQEPNGDNGVQNSNYVQLWGQGGWNDTSNTPPNAVDRPHGFVVEFESR